MLHFDEGLQNYTINLEHKHMLMDILEGLPPRPLEWPNLVAKGYNQCEYSAKKLNETKDTHRNGTVYQAQADMTRAMSLLA